VIWGGGCGTDFFLIKLFCKADLGLSLFGGLGLAGLEKALAIWGLIAF
jgi:hypothetical protein